MGTHLCRLREGQEQTGRAFRLPCGEGEKEGRKVGQKESETQHGSKNIWPGQLEVSSGPWTVREFLVSQEWAAPVPRPARSWLGAA